MDVRSLKQKFDLDLLRKRILYIAGEITDQMASEVGAAIVWLNTKSTDPVTLYIDSPGGSALAGLSIVDAVRNSAAPIDAVIYHQANSMASIIVQACRKRRMMRNARMCLHAIIVRRPVDLLDDDAKRNKAIGEMLAAQTHIEMVFAKRTGNKAKKIRELMRVGEGSTDLSAEKALELGFVDEII